MRVVSGPWQEAVVQEMARWLQPMEAIRAVALFGTAAGSQPDVWSDVDLLLVVDEAARAQFHPAMDWLEPLGEIYAWDQSSNPWASVTRACFAVVIDLEATRHPYTASGILDSLEQSSILFDALAAQWSETHREQRGPLLAWIDLARRQLRGEP
jgi:predicted nucleotidyltransferase